MSFPAILTKFKIIFVIGPSGVGKNWFSAILTRKINFHHLDIDVDGHFASYNLKKDWDNFRSTGDCRSLISNLQNKMNEEDCEGILLSLPSRKSSQLNKERIDLLSAKNVSTILLWGDKEFCLNSRIERDSKGIEGLSKSQYNRKNGQLFKEFCKSKYNPIRIEMFRKNGERLTFEEIMNQLSHKKLI